MTVETKPAGNRDIVSRAAADLVWFLSRDWEGELGVKSNMGPMLDRAFADSVIPPPDLSLKLPRLSPEGAERHLRHWHHQQWHTVPSTGQEGGSAITDHALDEDSPEWRAMVRYGRVSPAWRELRRGHRRRLRAVYAPPGDRLSGLEAFASTRTGDPLGGLLPLSAVVRDEHARSRSTYGLVEWLQRLSERYTGRRPHGNREQRRRDEQHVAAFLEEAELMLAPAWAAWSEAWTRAGRRKEMSRAA